MTGSGVDSLEVGNHREGALLKVKVRPRGRCNACEGIRNGALMVTVSAAPADGAANGAVIRVLADLLRCPQTRILLRHGGKSRDKTFLITGVSPQEVVLTVRSFFHSD